MPTPTVSREMLTRKPYRVTRFLLSSARGAWQECPEREPLRVEGAMRVPRMLSVSALGSENDSAGQRNARAWIVQSRAGAAIVEDPQHERWERPSLDQQRERHQHGCHQQTLRGRRPRCDEGAHLAPTIT